MHPSLDFAFYLIHSLLSTFLSYISSLYLSPSFPRFSSYTSVILNFLQSLNVHGYLPFSYLHSQMPDIFSSIDLYAYHLSYLTTFLFTCHPLPSFLPTHLLTCHPLPSYLTTYPQLPPVLLTCPSTHRCNVQSFYTYLYNPDVYFSTFIPVYLPKC